MINTYKELAREQLKLIDDEIKLLMEIREKAILYQHIMDIEQLNKNDFTKWQGGRQPDETYGRYVYVEFKDGDVLVKSADKSDWHHCDDPSDIIGYKIVD